MFRANNISFSNYLFGLVLKENGLILNHDILFEISDPISDAISFNFMGINSSVYQTPNYHEIYGTLNGVRNINFLHNGEYDEKLKRFINFVRFTGAFNIGICTPDELKYKRNRELYEKFKTTANNSFDMNVHTFEKDIDNHKVYVLSYRHK